MVQTNGRYGPRRDLLRAAQQLIAPPEVDIDRVVKAVLGVEAGEQFRSEPGALIDWKGQQFLTQRDRCGNRSPIVGK